MAGVKLLSWVKIRDWFLHPWETLAYLLVSLPWLSYSLTWRTSRVLVLFFSRFISLHLDSDARSMLCYVSRVLWLHLLFLGTSTHRGPWSLDLIITI
jgi:hypothetical protein